MLLYLFTMIELQLNLLRDTLRNEAFYQALKKVIVPSKTTIADIGSGTGFLSFVAEKLGAKSCTLYEIDPEMLTLSKKLGKENNVKRCRYVLAHSTQVKKPSLFDVVISETLGNYSLEENILETLQDAKRFLKPGGIMIPSRLEQFVAPVTSPRLSKTIDIWDSVGYGLSFSGMKTAALNNMYVEKVQPQDIGDPSLAKQWDSIDFMAKEKSVRTSSISWSFPKKEAVYAFALWWKADLLPGIAISTSPFSSRTHWDQIVLPLMKPIHLQPGEKLDLSLTSDSRLSVGVRLQWQVKNSLLMDTKKGIG